MGRNDLGRDVPRGVAVVEVLMALYRSAWIGRTVELPDEELETCILAVSQGGFAARAASGSLLSC